MKILAMVQIQTAVQKKWPGEQEHVKKKWKEQAADGSWRHDKSTQMYQKVQKNNYNSTDFKTSKRVYIGDEAVVHHLGETART